MKKTLALVLALVLALCCLTACGSTTAAPAASGDAAPAASGDAAPAAIALEGKDIATNDIKIAYVPVSTQGGTTEIAQKAADDVMAKYSNVAINFFDAGYDPTTQVTIISDCIAQGYDALILECTDEIAINPVVLEAEQKGIVVFTTNMNCSAVHSAYLNSNSYDLGWCIGEQMIADLGGKGDVILLDCPASMVASTLHGKGFQDCIEQNSEINIIDYANIDGFSTENANTTMRDMLTKYDKIDAVYAMADDMAIGVMQAIDAAGRSDEGILIYGSEGMPNAIEAIREGTIRATSWSDRYNLLYVSFNAALLYIDAGMNSVSLNFQETPAVSMPAKTITNDNVESMIPFLRYSALQ